jgi:hypothetical protein
LVEIIPHNEKKMNLEEYQASLLSELGATSIDDLLPKIEMAIEKVKLIPGIPEFVKQLGVKMEMSEEFSYMFLFSIDLWQATLQLLNGGSDLQPFQAYLSW